MKITNYYKFSDLPFSELPNSVSEIGRELAVQKFLATTGLKRKNEWFLPQLTSHIASMTLPARNAQGLLDPKAFLSINMKNNAYNLGIYYLCTHRLRGDLVQDQNRPFGVDYSALVPLLLMPFKKLHNIDYSTWDRDELHRLLDPNLADLLRFVPDTVYTKEELLDLRQEALIVKTGEKKGTAKKPQSTIKVPGQNGFMPWYTQVTTFQIWVAHPSIRHKYMILDSENLDNMPEPLIESEVLITKPDSKTPEKAKPIMPWD
jgi:hypothetical protein